MGYFQRDYFEGLGDKMRIIIDGACGSGKTTFLTEIKNRITEKHISNIQVFNELIKGSINEGRNQEICPPKNDSDWEKLFTLVLDRGISQYENSAFNGIAWLDRGLPFLNVFAKEHDKKLPDEMIHKIMKYIYDVVFLFEPIPSLDLSTVDNGKFRLFSLDERRASYEMTYKEYQKSGHRVYRLPYYSNDTHYDFFMKLNAISKTLHCDFNTDISILKEFDM